MYAALVISGALGGDMQAQQDQELLERFHLMDADEREFQLEVFRLSTEGRQPKSPPSLTLILGGVSASGTLGRNFG